MMAQTGRPPAPHSTVQRCLQSRLAQAIHRFLFSESQQFPGAHLVRRVLLGAAIGTVLFLGLTYNTPLNFDLKLAAGCSFLAVCVAVAALSSHFRCSLLLMFLGMFGSFTRLFMTTLILSALFAGPIANTERNMEAAALSVSCNLDLQIRHSKLLWREAIKPFMIITEQLMGEKAALESKALNISKSFHDVREEIGHQYAYDQFETKHGSNSTQEEFTTKTLKQCENVVAQGVQRCTDWFSSKWTACMEAVSVPVIQHIICVPMKFPFLCDITRVMTPWCKENIPVQGNFGQLFDQLNTSVDLLSREFSAELVVEEKEQQSLLGGAVLDRGFTEAVKASFLKVKSAVGQVLDVLQWLFFFTRLTIFIQAFGYLGQYKRVIGFNNIFITRHFRRLDARRKRAGKRHLLPLKKSERKQLIDPWSPRMHPTEVKKVVLSMFYPVMLALLTAGLLIVDSSVVYVLDIISRHTFTQFNITSSQRFIIEVGGDTMMARLLRSSVSAFNTSSNLNIHSDNQECVSPPSPLPADVYVTLGVYILLIFVFSCLGVYTKRLQQVTAAFYYPKREEQRTLFLYSIQLDGRIVSAGSRRDVGREKTSQTVFQRLNRWGRYLFWLLDEEEASK